MLGTGRDVTGALLAPAVAAEFPFSAEGEARVPVRSMLLCGTLIPARGGRTGAAVAVEVAGDWAVAAGWRAEGVLG